MTENFRFEIAKKDLDYSPESVKTRTFEQEKKELQEGITSVKGKEPDKKKLLIKKIVFGIKDDTPFKKVQNIAEYIDQTLGTHCFQIAVYRDKKQAQLLVDTIERDTGNSIVFHNLSRIKKVSAYIDITLGNEPPREPGDIRYFLLSLYDLNNAVFTGLKSRLSDNKLTESDRSLIGKCLTYAEGVCKNILK